MRFPRLRVCRQALDGTRLEDVAARAKVSKGLPYLYFKTKVELFKAVVRSVITTHFDAMRERMEKTDLSVEALLKGPFLSFIQELVGSKRAFIARLLIAEGHKHPELTAFYFETVVSRGIETLTRLMDRGIESGEFKPTRLRDFPQLLVAPALTAIIWRTLFERHRHLDTNAMLATTNAVSPTSERVRSTPARARASSRLPASSLATKVGTSTADIRPPGRWGSRPAGRLLWPPGRRSGAAPTSIRRRC